jgi:hypothetical protein
VSLERGVCSCAELQILFLYNRIYTTIGTCWFFILLSVVLVGLELLMMGLDKTETCSSWRNILSYMLCIKLFFLYTNISRCRVNRTLNFGDGNIFFLNFSTPCV